MYSILLRLHAKEPEVKVRSALATRQGGRTDVAFRTAKRC